MEEKDKTRLVAQYLYEHNYKDTLQEFLKETGTQFVEQSMIHKTGELDLILDEHQLQLSKIKPAITIYDIFPKGDKINHILPSRVLWRIDDVTGGKNVIVSRLRSDGTLFISASDSLLYKLSLGPDLDKVPSDILLNITTEMPQSESLIKPLTPIPTVYKIHKGAVLGLDIHPHQPDIIVTSSMDRSVAIADISLDPDDIEFVKQRFRDHSKYVVAVGWSPTGAYFASVGYDSVMNVYHGCVRETEGKYQVQYDKVYSEQHRGGIEGLCFMRGREVVATCCREDFLVHVYEMALPTKGSNETFQGSVSKIQEINLNAFGDDFISLTPMHLSFSPDNRHLLVSTDRDRLIVLSLQSGEVVTTLYGATSDGFSQPKNSWHSSCAYVYGTSEDNTVCVWEVVTQKIVSKLSGHQGRIRDMQGMVYKGRPFLVTGSFDTTVCIWC